MALAPQLSRAAYRRGYLQSLSRQAANEAYNLEANLRWLQDGDVEGEAEKAATIQGMARGAIDSKVIELVNYIVRQPDRGYVLSRIPLDQKRWLLINEEIFLAELTKNSRAIPVSGMEFLSVLAATVRPVKQDDIANVTNRVVSQEGQTNQGDSVQDNVSPPQGPGPTGTQTLTEAVTDQLATTARQTASPPLSHQGIIQQKINGLTGHNPEENDRVVTMNNDAHEQGHITSAENSRNANAIYGKVQQAAQQRQQAGLAPNEHYIVQNTRTGRWHNLTNGDEYEEEDDDNSSVASFESARSGPQTYTAQDTGYGGINSGWASWLFGGSEGEGFNRRRRKRPTKTYIRGAGMNPAPGAREPSHNWQQFGRYVLSRNDLENGSSVHIRYRNGQPVKNIGPKRVVGGSVGAIVRDIADGKAPQQKHMSQITEDEREYLSGLIKTCNIAIPKGVKTEKKTPKQKEHNEFEILKGQVLAGNDNPEIIKKFKNMLKKMVQSGQLNADDVRAIVDELP